jgi:phenylalanyl-tRNA synthetase beta chain
VRIELRDDEQTLNDERIDQSIKQVIEAVAQSVGGRVRA